MSRREGNQIQAKITLPDNLKSEDIRVGPNVQLTFEMISEWIKIQGFDEYTEQGLINLAAHYPTSALKSFRRNFNLMIARVREQRKKDQQREENTNDKIRQSLETQNLEAESCEPKNLEAESCEPQNLEAESCEPKNLEAESCEPQNIEE
jgi:hypothetical protein